MLFEWLNAFALGLRRVADTHHKRHIRTIHVGIHEACFVPHLRERDREVHRHRGLSDAAFTGAHRNQISHTGDRQFWLLASHIRAHSAMVASDRMCTGLIW
jgi:hypothetical protein